MLSVILTLFLISSPVFSKATYAVESEEGFEYDINYDVESSDNLTDVESIFFNENDSEFNIERETGLNKLIDRALDKLIDRLSEENQGKLALPNLNNEFSTGSSAWKVKGKFSAVDGIFENLTTLKRSEKAVLKKKGKKLTASCGVELSQAVVDYKKYNLKYGFVKVGGKLSGSIDGLSVSITASIDFNPKPCTTTIDEIKVTKFGNVKVEITGLGALNKLMSKLVNWVSNKWRDEIVERIEDKLMDGVLKNLEKFDCEKYRIFG